MSRADDLSAVRLVQQRLIDNDFDVYRARPSMFDLRLAAFSPKNSIGMRISISRIIDGKICLLRDVAESESYFANFYALTDQIDGGRGRAVYVVPTQTVHGWARSHRSESVKRKSHGQVRAFQEIPVSCRGVDDARKHNDEMEDFFERWDLLELA